MAVTCQSKCSNMHFSLGLASVLFRAKLFHGSMGMLLCQPVSEACLNMPILLAERMDVTTPEMFVDSFFVFRGHKFFLKNCTVCVENQELICEM